MIPVCAPVLGAEEQRSVGRAVRAGFIGSAGPWIPEFERRWAAYCGAAHGVAACNGTAALHLALLALGVGPGDEVLVPDFAMVSVLFSVLYCGATPVLVDAEDETGNLDVPALAAKITRKTKVLVAVHTYGHPCDMDPILALARARGLKVLEDAAEAHGAEYKGRRCGGLGHAAAFSFYANKLVTTGEGGMVVTRDAALARRARYFRNLCFPDSGPRRYEHDELGYNYRLTSLQAALGVAQCGKIGAAVAARRRNARLYAERLAGLPGLRLPVEKPWARSVYWMYGVRVDARRAGVDRDALARALACDGVETRPFFTPLHRQKPYRERFGARGARYPVSERLSREGLYLPSGGGLTERQIDRVCASVRRALK